MNKETYEALKRIMIEYFELSLKYVKKSRKGKVKDIQQVQGWIDEVAKEYEE